MRNSTVMPGFEPARQRRKAAYCPVKRTDACQESLPQEKDCSREGKLEFIIDHAVWLLTLMFLHRALVFRCPERLPLSASKAILWGIVAVSCFISVCLEMKNNRRLYNAVFNVLFGFGIYTAIAYYGIRPKLITTSLFIALLLILLLLCTLIIRKRRDAIIHKRNLRFRIPVLLSAVHKIITASLAVIMIIIGMDKVWSSSLVKPSVSPSAKEKVQEQTIANHILTLSALGDGSWNTKTIKEKLDVLQTAANIEQHYLGLPHELYVGASDLNEDESGHYEDSIRQITISINRLMQDSPWDVLGTVCHEAYHCYQYRLIDVMNSIDERDRNLNLFRKAHAYSEEFDHYNDGKGDLLAYYSQHCEIDAWDYAEEAVADYQRRIREYLYPQGNYRE